MNVKESIESLKCNLQGTGVGNDSATQESISNPRVMPVPTRTRMRRTPPGFRVLHVLLPEPLFLHHKVQACMSGLRFAEYIAKYLSGNQHPQANELLGVATDFVPRRDEYLS